MYSIQHVLWRGAMALSLLVVGGFGAYSAPVGTAHDIGCDEAIVVAHAIQSAHAAAQVAVQRTIVQSSLAEFRHVQFDTIVVRGTPPGDA